MTFHSMARRGARTAFLAILLFALPFAVAACGPRENVEIRYSVEETRLSPADTRRGTASATVLAAMVASREATLTPTRQPTPTATSSSTASPTQTPTASATLTATPSSSPTPIPSPTARRLRLLIPQALIGRAQLLTPFMQGHPGYTFLVEVAPSSTDVAASLGMGHVDLGVFEGALPADLTAYVYRSEPVAAIVSFYKRMEAITLDELVSLVAGKEDVWERLRIDSVGVWDSAVMGLSESDLANVSIAAPEYLVSQVAGNVESLAIVPVSALVPSVRGLTIDGYFLGDAEYPLIAREAVLVSDPTLNGMAKELADVLAQATVANPSVAELAMVGDIMLARDMGDALRQNGPDYAFGAVRHLLQRADLTVGNLECVVGDVGEPEPKAYTFQAPVTATTSLREAGFDLLNLANNHILDFGVQAMAQTFELLGQAGIGWVGAGMSEREAYAPVFRDVRGLRIAFLGYANYMTETSTGFPADAFVAIGDRPGIAWADVDRISADVARVKGQADVVIVALHAGREYWERPTDFQRVSARAAIDAGASIVWGHHAHSWQGVEFYKKGVILYSLGDFVFDQMTTNDTAVAKLWIDALGVRQLWLDPVVIVENGRPVPALEREGRAILDWLYGLSELLVE